MTSGKTTARGTYPHTEGCLLYTSSIIRSKEFEERLTQLGGYTFTDTGKMVEYLD